MTGLSHLVRFPHQIAAFISLLPSCITFPVIVVIQGESLARGPMSMYTVEHRELLVRKYWQTGLSKACQTAFRNGIW